jgi:hypothetical protein
VGAAIAADLSKVFSIVQVPEVAKSPELKLILLMGVSESLSPAVLGFSLLAVAALLCAYGERRALRTTR